jgi:hypothetical protein
LEDLVWTLIEKRKASLKELRANGLYVVVERFQDPSKLSYVEDEKRRYIHSFFCNDFSIRNQALSQLSGQKEEIVWPVKHKSKNSKLGPINRKEGITLSI